MVATMNMRGGHVRKTDMAATSVACKLRLNDEKEPTM